MSKVERYKMGYARGKQNLEHILVAENMFGGQLPAKSVIHHINGDRFDNRPENLMICRDQAHHFSVHRQQRAIEACGNADWLKCPYCKKYAPPSELALVRYGRSGYHRACANARRIITRSKKK